jgi:hypothetical protein
MNGVAPKIAQEVRVFLKNQNFHARTRKQISQHHPRGSAAGDAAVDGNRLERHS